MEKVDIAIAIAGIVALIATGLGIVLYDAGDDYTYTTVHSDLAAQSGAVTEVGDDFTWDAPDNTTGAQFEVTVTATPGTPADSGAVSVTLRLQGPGGQELVTETGSFNLADGSGTFTIDASGWLEVPDDFTGSDETLDANTHHWDDVITLTVVVDGPGSSLPVPGFPSPTYNADITGSASVYQAVSDLPDPEVV